MMRMNGVSGDWDDEDCKFVEDGENARNMKNSQNENKMILPRYTKDSPMGC